MAHSKKYLLISISSLYKQQGMDEDNIAVRIEVLRKRTVAELVQKHSEEKTFEVLARARYYGVLRGEENAKKQTK